MTAAKKQAAPKKVPGKRPHRATGRPRGRPSVYTEKVADEIVRRISDGESLRTICLDQAMPSWGTVYDWIDSKVAFSARIAKAREIGYDALAHEIMVISDTPTLGQRRKTVTRDIEVDGNVLTLTHTEVFEEDMLGHRKLQTDNRRWLLSRWSKRYADRIDHNHTGEMHVHLSTEDQGVC